MPSWTAMSVEDFNKVLDEAEALMRTMRERATATNPLAIALAGAAMISVYCKNYDGDAMWFFELAKTGDIAAFLRGPSS